MVVAPGPLVCVVWLALAPSWPMAVEGPGERAAYVPADRSPEPVSGDIRANPPIRAIPAQPTGWPMAQPDRSLVPGRQPGVVTPMILVGGGEAPPAGTFAGLPALACPDGGKQVDRAPQYGSTNFEQWCERDGRRHGPTATWHANAAIWIRGQYVHGVQAGTWTRWHETGELQASDTYVDGKPHGVSREWHRNGQLQQESHFRGGQRHGMTTRWYANGQVFVATRYIHDKVADGIHTFYYESGAVIDRGRYVNGQRHGVWTIYDPAGAVTQRQRWVRGVPTP